MTTEPLDEPVDAGAAGRCARELAATAGRRARRGRRCRGPTAGRRRRPRRRAPRRRRRSRVVAAGAERPRAIIRPSSVLEEDAVTQGGLILAVESSCDETGIALVEDGRRIHLERGREPGGDARRAPGGIVPEVAARAHLRWIVPVLDEAWAAAGVGWDDISAVAVTEGPGLAGSLLVGINFAKTLAYVHGKPLVPVNHLEGHLYAAWLADDDARGRRADLPARRPDRVRRAHVPGGDARPPARTGCSARRSTTRPARRSTRWAGCSACRIRAARRS